MAPPIQYPRDTIAKALRAAYSLKQAAHLVGMSLGAMRKRAFNDPLLRPLAERCRSRGLDVRANWRTEVRRRSQEGP